MFISGPIGDGDGEPVFGERHRFGQHAQGVTGLHKAHTRHIAKQALQGFGGSWCHQHKC